MTTTPRFEHNKFSVERERYGKTLQSLLALELKREDYIHHFPAVAGELTLARYLSLYEAYKMTVGIAGHIAEVGIGLGSVSILFAKLVKMFEPNALTLVHGFDWFKGAAPTAEEKFIKEGECQRAEKLVNDLITVQGLEHSVHIHNLNVATQLDAFLSENQHMMFKLVFLDCGIYDVVAAAIRGFWPRIVPGGLLIFDHFSHEFAPGEARAIRELLPDVAFKQFPFGWMPVAYAVR